MKRCKNAPKPKFRADETVKIAHFETHSQNLISEWQENCKISTLHAVKSKVQKISWNWMINFWFALISRQKTNSCILPKKMVFDTLYFHSFYGKWKVEQRKLSWWKIFWHIVFVTSKVKSLNHFKYVWDVWDSPLY